MMEIVYICIWYVGRMSEELYFQLYLILINLNVHYYMWQAATVFDRAELEFHHRYLMRVVFFFFFY